MLSIDEIILISVVVIALIMIVSNRIRPDLVALCVLLALAFSGIISTSEALSGFSSPAVITLLGLFIITRALEVTGIIQWVGRRLNTIGRGSEGRLIFIFMTTGALLSLIMNNVAAGAVLLPAAVQVGRDSNVPLSRLLIPLSFGTLVGGMATYLTTANIIMGSLLEEQNLRGLGMLDFIPTGSVIVFASLIYMLTIGRRLLPKRDGISQAITAETNLYETYDLGQRMWEVQIPAESWLVGKQIKDSGIGQRLGLTVLGVWRGHKAILAPPSGHTIEQGDFLLVLGHEDRVQQLVEWGAALRGRKYEVNGGEHNYAVELTEVVIPPRSEAIGKSLTELDYRRKYGLTAVALWREGRSYRTDVGKFPLQVGDAILMVGPEHRVESMVSERDYLVLHSQHHQTPPAADKAIYALIITAVVLSFAVTDILPLPLVALTGAVAIILSGCMKLEEAYEAVEWQVIFLIAGMLPISIGLINTGLADRIGQWMVSGLADFGVLPLIIGMFTLTIFVAQVIGGQVTALVVGPIAISATLQVDSSSAQAMAVAVAIGCSTAFLTPIAHPVNILMMGPGGYQFSDFFRVGLGNTIIVLLGLIAGMIIFWGIPL